MRIQVTLDSDTGSLTIHAEGCTAATPPARLAATLASIVETILTEPAPPAQPSSADQPPPADQPPVDQLATDPGRPAAVAADQRPASTPSTGEAAAVQLAVTATAAPEVGPEVPAEVVAVDVPVEDGGQDEQLRRAALRLLDDGLTDIQVCAQLGISRSRLLRWDDPDGQFLHPLVEGLAAVTA
jgi:Homeodomain-like domain